MTSHSISDSDEDDKLYSNTQLSAGSKFARNAAYQHKVHNISPSDSENSHGEKEDGVCLGSAWSARNPSEEQTLAMPQVQTISSESSQLSTIQHSTQSSAISDISYKRKRRPNEVIEAEREIKRAAQEEKKRLREETKKAKEKEREEKKKAKDERKLMQPGECLKLITTVVDIGLVQLARFGATVLNELQSMPNLRVDVATQSRVSMATGGLCVGVSWRRVDAGRVLEVADDAGEEEEEVLVVLRGEEFVSMMTQKVTGGSGPDLFSLVRLIKDSGLRPTLAVIELDKEMKKKHPGLERRPGPAIHGMSVVKQWIESVTLDLSIEHHVMVRLCETPNDLARLARNFTKAISERPFKAQRFRQVFNYYAPSVSNGCRVEKRTGDGKGGDGASKEHGGVDTLLRHQLLQLKGLSGEMASAVLSQYSTPRALYNAYHKDGVINPKGVQLLENIEIRRGAGLLSTSRRLGKEISRRLFEFLTIDNPDHVIK